MDVFNLIVGKLSHWAHTAIKLLPNLAIAILIVIIFFIIGRLLRKFTARLLEKVTDNKTIIDLLETIVGVLIIGVGIVIALGILNLDGFVATFLAGAGVVGLALGFAFQDIASNFISGVLLSIRHPFHKGDIIESKGYYGTVKELNLRSTLIKTPQGKVVYIPNKDVYGDPLENYSKDHERRIDLACGVSYGDDLEKAKRVAIEAVESLENINHDREVQFIYDEFGGSSINFKIRFWVDFQSNMDYLGARSDAIIAITKRYDEEDIMIPFPIRTLDFGIRGGEKLDSVLPKGNAESNGEPKGSEGRKESSDEQ